MLFLLLWKNLLIRKRHWFLTATEVSVPVILFTLLAYERSTVNGLNKVQIDSATYYETITSYGIYSHLPVSEIHLWYCPYNEFTEDIVRRIQEEFQMTADAIKPFRSKSDLLEHFQQNSSSATYVVTFEGSNLTHLKYEIGIFDQYLVWDTDKLFFPLTVNEDTTLSKYLLKGFAALQFAIDKAFLQMHNPTQDILFSIQEFPFPPYVDDSGLSVLFIRYLPLVTMISFIFLCPAVIQRVGEEKQSGTKEFMKIVGVKSWMIWLGWLIHALITNMLSIIMVIVIMKVPFWGVPYPLIEFTDGVVLFVFLFFYCMAALTFCFLIATIETTPTAASAAGIFLWLLSYFLPQQLVASNDGLEWKYKILLGLFPNMGLYYGYSAISVYEIREVGVQWYNIMQPGSGSDEDVTLFHVFIMFLIDVVLFMVLTLYIENIKPGKYGIAKPYFFPFTNIKCWIKRRNRNQQDEENPLKNTRENRSIIQIVALNKTFGKQVVVHDLNLDIYRNQITMLLGHNGAGKTTTMSMITGMINASNGHIIINNKDINRDADVVRKGIGLCPQHNLLFPDLTVIEQLMFFGKLRGSDHPRKEATTVLEKLGLSGQANKLPFSLSGGMKRKVCLGMAMVGNSDILILDEPTSGMDTESRRKCWDILLEYKKSKTILISTHFMEEADVLGDHIAIMNHGTLQCYNTPMELKKKYNTGYHFTLTFDKNSKISDSKLRKEIITKVEKFIRSRIPEAKLIKESYDTFVFLLPLNQNQEITIILEFLEKRKSEWYINYMSLNITTLNDVFLKTRLENNEDPKLLNEQPIHQTPTQETFTRTKHTRLCLQICALILKRWYFLKREILFYIPALFFSICTFLLAIFLPKFTMANVNDGGPELNLNLDLYGKNCVIYGGNNSTSLTSAKLRETYRESIVQQNGDPFLQEDVSAEIIKRGIDNMAFYKRQMVVAAEFNVTENKNEVLVNALYSPRAYHSLPISINLAMNAVIKTFLNESFSITVRNSPLKQTASDFTPSELSKFTVLTLWVIFVPFGMTILIGNYMFFPNSEVTTNYFHIQSIAGISSFLFWFTNSVFDIIMGLFQMIIFLGVSLTIIDYVFYDFTFFRKEEIGAIAFICLTFAVASIPFTYLFSYTKIEKGHALQMMSVIVLGILPFITMESLQNQDYLLVAQFLKHIFLVISPQFGFIYNWVGFSYKFVDNLNWKYMDPRRKFYICLHEPNPCCNGETSNECTRYKSYFDNEEHGILYDVLEMYASFAAYFLILAFGTTWFRKIQICLLSTSPKHDADTKQIPNIALSVRKLCKKFGGKNIIEKLNLNIGKQKCFGLLGVNGAGKTTTFRILTKNLLCDSGDIRIIETKKNKEIGVSIFEDRYSKMIGYCPQENSLNESLSANEILFTLALMNGYSFTTSKHLSEHLITTFGLQEYPNLPCYAYSGGNKRKLNTCIAFLDNRNIIMLDEPTSGVDPLSCRLFWDFITQFKKNQNSSVILCSHSMEETEKICDEVAIMKGGTVKASGSPNSLRNMFKVGYKITIKVGNDCKDEDLTKIKNALNKSLDSKPQEEHGNSFEYLSENKRLSHLFRHLETFKEEHSYVEDYSITEQTSFEDAFLRVAKDKTNDTTIV